jgi:hypothetical protein
MELFMKNRHFAALFLTGFATTGTLMFASAARTEGTDQATGSQAAVVELFTSQGCSSCPPADAFVEELARNPDVVAITRPVTYWDRLGWKDTLAKPENTERQKAYAARGGEGSGVYTPQTMVQGEYGAVGSNRGTVQSQIAKARKSASVAIALRPGLIAVAGTGASAEVRVIGLRSSSVVRIGRGENGGRVVRYSNVYVGEKSLGRWNGTPQTFKLPALNMAGADRYGVIVQSGNGPILAGRYI